MTAKGFAPIKNPAGWRGWVHYVKIPSDKEGFMILAPLILALAAQCDLKGLSKKDRELLSKTPEEIASVVDIQDDPFQPALKLQFGPFTSKDAFSSYAIIRSFVSRKNKSIDYQIYVRAIYDGEHRDYSTAAYMDGDNPISLRVNKLDTSVLSCGAYRRCTISEDLTFEIPERVLKVSADQAKVCSEDGWQFRLYDRFGDYQSITITGTIVAAAILRTNYAKTLITDK
ncbi:hypothetical protein FHW96_000237 [Novosphingobium sp. SG751A]|uniref:hypothetical protein n=1 Tax=Novosphingobium sp. SG751A TaxID=2587000 RepID=UPI00155681C3|nr:hypothetical protein [Novosphingobium sp. SG751A]NOW44110.1 hypothetical protein [Novosphingobium sp. SG751A]